MGISVKFKNIVILRDEFDSTGRMFRNADCSAFLLLRYDIQPAKGDIVF